MRSAASPFVFMYHGVIPRQSGRRSRDLGALFRDDFERQLLWMKRRFTMMHPEEAADRLERGQPAPPRTALLTFDDGYQNLLEHALPAAEAAGIVPLAFVSTGHLSGAEWLWSSRLSSSRIAGGPDLVPPFVRRPTMTLAEIERFLDEHGAPRRAGTNGLCRLLFDGADADALRRHAARGALVVGGHTVGHPYLPRESAEVRRAEIRENRRVLEDLVGRPVRLFAYPSGAVDAETAREVKEAGYAAAFSIHPPGPAFPEDLRRYHLPRTGVEGPERLLFLLKCAGLDAWRWRAGLLR